MTGLVSGKPELRKLFSRLVRWRVRARWYAAALLTGPVLVARLLFGLTLLSPAFTPGLIASNDKIGLLLFGIAWGSSAAASWRNSAGRASPCPS